MSGIAFVIFLAMIFLAGYLKGRHRYEAEVVEMETYIEAMEAAQRITLRARRTANAMEDVARSMAQRTEALPPYPHALPDN